MPGQVPVHFAKSLCTGIPGLIHGFTAALTDPPGAHFGSAVEAHLRLRLGSRAPRVHWLLQRHSAVVLPVPLAPDADGSNPAALSIGDGTIGEGAMGEGDGAVLAGGQAGVAAIQSADCVPVLALDEASGAAAALHAGWRGTALGILPVLPQSWAGEGASPGRIRLAFGPAIRACCYEVKQDCLERFDPAHLAGAVETRDGRTYLELTAVLRNQAIALGVSASNIEVLPQCTYCHADSGGNRPFASYRREGRPGEPFPYRNLSYIGFAGASAGQRK